MVNYNYWCGIVKEMKDNYVNCIAENYYFEFENTLVSNWPDKLLPVFKGMNEDTICIYCGNEKFPVYVFDGCEIDLNKKDVDMRILKVFESFNDMVIDFINGSEIYDEINRKMGRVHL